MSQKPKKPKCFFDRTQDSILISAICQYHFDKGIKRSNLRDFLMQLYDQSKFGDNIYPKELNHLQQHLIRHNQFVADKGSAFNLKTLITYIGRTIGARDSLTKDDRYQYRRRIFDTCVNQTGEISVVQEPEQMNEFPLPPKQPAVKLTKYQRIYLELRDEMGFDHETAKQYATK